MPLFSCVTWANCIISGGFTFFICKIEVTAELSGQGHWEVRSTVYKAPRSVAGTKEKLKECCWLVGWLVGFCQGKESQVSLPSHYHHVVGMFPANLQSPMVSPLLFISTCVHF